MAYLEKELEDIPDDANIILGDDNIHSAYQLKPYVVCGGFQALMPYYCVRPPGHEGKCYCPNKNVDFDPDTEEQIREIYDSIKNDIPDSI